MPQRRGRFPPGHDANLLKHLVPHASHLYLDRGTVRTHEKFPVPVNEYLIPQRHALITSVIGTMASHYAWSGRSDVHHIAWPFSAYRALNTPDMESVGEAYRSTPSVKVRTRRQMHDYIHLAFEAPPIPDEDVMVQYLAEEALIRQLLKLISLTEKERIGKFFDDELEQQRHERYLDKLHASDHGIVGHLPDHQLLVSLDAQGARTVLSERVRITDYTGLEP